ncbi:MAG: sulfite exporter TauE/SafE family protein [Pseudolabrys sp.]
MIDPLYSISGFGVGLLVGMTGVGGGSLMTPILILLFGVHPATAVGTDLLYAAATKTGGSLVHGLARSIDWPMVRRLATGSIPATIVTLALLSFLNLNSMAARSLITVVLCFALFLTAGVLIFRKTILNYYQGRFPTLDPHKTALATVLVGALLGVLVSISSVGAGAIGVMALVILYPNLPMARIVGSDIAHAVPLTLIAGMGHWMFGAVDWQIIGSLLIGSLPGIFLGSYFTTRVPEPALRLLLAATLILVAGKLAYDHIENSTSLLTAFTKRVPQ